MRTDQVIVVSNWPWCFTARTNPKIVVSNRPWCFLAKTDQMVVQVFDEFSIGIEVLFNYLVFVLCTPSCSSLRGSVKVCFFSCFFICLYLPSWIHMMNML